MDVIRQVWTVSECICNGVIFVLKFEICNITSRSNVMLFYSSSSGTHATGQIQGNLRLKHLARTTLVLGEQEKLFSLISHSQAFSIQCLCVPTPLLCRGPSSNRAPLPVPTAASFCLVRWKKGKGRQLASSMLGYMPFWLLRPWPIWNLSDRPCCLKTEHFSKSWSTQKNLSTHHRPISQFCALLRNRYLFLSYTQSYIYT